MADSNSTILDLLLMDIGSHDNDWGDQTNATLSAIETAIKAARATASTGGTTTLSKTQSREYLQRVTGVLASNAVIEVPNVSSRWLFSNETTGNFTLTVKVTGQTGVVVPQGSAMILRGNGTDVVAVQAPQPRGVESKARTVGGTVDALTLTFVPALPGRYPPGATLKWTSPGVNTVTNPNLNGDAIGTITIKKGANAALAAGDLGPSGYQCEGLVNDDASAIILMNPATQAVSTSSAQVYSQQQSFDGGIGLAGPHMPPGGRLTLVDSVPVITGDQTAKTTVYYTPYLSNGLMLYDGTRWVEKSFTQMSQALSDTTKSPSASSAGNVYDMFVWNDAGTLRCTRGPSFTVGGGSVVARGFGAGSTELERFNGALVNKYDITNGPAARRGLYVGTIAPDGANQLNMNMNPAAAAGGTANRLDVWNNYNRVDVAAMCRESTDSWTYNTTVTRPVNNSTNNRITFVIGASEDAVHAISTAASESGGGSRDRINSIGVDSTTAWSGYPGFVTAAAGQIMSGVAHYRGLPGVGVHYVQALEYGESGDTSTWYGDAGNSSFFQSGLSLMLKM